MKGIERFISYKEMLILPDDEKLQYSGRIDFKNKREPLLIYPSSSIAIKFTGTTCKAIIKNKQAYWTNYLGCFIDGEQKTIEILNDDQSCLTLAEGLEDKEHTLLLFKRMDGCHRITFYGFVLDDHAKIVQIEDKPKRRIEVYGDSVSAGEVSEAVDYVGKVDPEHHGEFSNSWYSYGWMTARKLNAEIHNIAQGGIALLDHTGWFGTPDKIGLESTYNKLQYNPDLGEITPWNFKKYIPQVVVVAIGQNDNHPIDYMAADYYSNESKRWRMHYKEFVLNLRKIYKNATIILSTTILGHDPSWDRSIEEVCKEIQDDKVYHFMYSQNGVGTCGHIRISEAEQMSKELTVFIEGLGEKVWEN